MSRWYEMYVEITDHNPLQALEIEEALEDEWEWNSIHDTNNALHGTGQSNLCGGESEQEFAERVCKAVWEANGGFCRVHIRATCLEDSPSECYDLDEEKYKEIMARTPAKDDEDEKK